MFGRLTTWCCGRRVTLTYGEIELEGTWIPAETVKVIYVFCLREWNCSRQAVVNVDSLRHATNLIFLQFLFCISTYLHLLWLHFLWGIGTSILHISTVFSPPFPLLPPYRGGSWGGNPGGLVPCPCGQTREIRVLEPLLEVCGHLRPGVGCRKGWQSFGSWSTGEWWCCQQCTSCSGDGILSSHT